jgi:hypothetical protein
MSVIDMKKWILTEQKRIKREIFLGEKSRKLTKRSLHLQNILAMFASKEASNVNFKLRHRSNLWKASHLMSEAQPYIFPSLT